MFITASLFYLTFVRLVCEQPLIPTTLHFCTADSAQTQRLLSSGAVVLLFVRLVGQPYMSLGRLVPRSCDVSSLPIAVTWQLQDFEVVRNQPAFQEILAIQQRHYNSSGDK